MSYSRLPRVDGVDLEWLLVSPVSVTGLKTQGYRVDLEVSHNLVCGVDPADADLPRVVRIGNLEPIGGQDLGDGVLRLNLGDLAVDAVVAVTRIGWFMVREPGSEMWQPPDPRQDYWRVVARVIRSACFKYGGRMRWSDQLNARLIEMVAHIAEHGCGTVTDIADELGTTAARVHYQLNQLRKTHDIPRLQPGRPSR